MRLLLVIALLLSQEALAQNLQIGAAAAVSGKVQAAGKIVQSGAPIFRNDRVVTDTKGRLQVLLLDETVFTIGPNSDLILDEFVYDPNTSAGKVSARVTKGVFRFVTGKVAKREPGSMKVTTPVGTIGIRGTIAGGQVDADKTTIVLLGPGLNNNTGDTPGGLNVANDQGGVDINQPNYGTTMGPGSAPSDPQPMPEFAAALSETLDNDSAGGSSAGADGASASEDSGQETAAGGTGASDSSETADLSEDVGEDMTLAQQDSAQSLLPKQASWANLRELGGNPGGVWSYGTSGTYTCSAGVCGAGSSGNASFIVYVNFDSKQVGSGGVSTISMISGPISDSVSIPVTNFSALQGDAKITYSGLTSANGDFSGTTLAFENDPGQAAADAVFDMNYVHSSTATADALLSAGGVPQ